MSGVTDEQAVTGGPGDDLPEEVTDQLRAVARARTSGTTPWPRVHVAVRRSRRRRVAGVTALTATLVAAAAIAGVTLRPEQAPQPADRGTEQTPLPSWTASHPPDPDPMNLAGATAGSLGDDRAWLDSLKAQMVADGLAPDATRVRVLWATDHAGVRHALTVTQATAGYYGIDRWRGPAGAAPGEMSWGDIPREMIKQLSHGSPRALPLENGRVPAEVFQIRDGTGNEGPGLLVTIGSDLSKVEVASRIDYDAAGRKIAGWSPMTPDAAVWVHVASDEELDTMRVRIVGPDGKRVPGRGGYSYSDIKVPPLDLAAVAEPGTDPEILACAAMAFSPERGGFPAGSTPLLGSLAEGGPRLGGPGGRAGTRRRLPRRPVPHAEHDGGLEQRGRAGGRLRAPGAGRRLRRPVRRPAGPAHAGRDRRGVRHRAGGSHGGRGRRRHGAGP